MKMSSIKKNFLYNATYQILAILIPLITTPYISRVLGADGIGVYSYSYSVAHYYAIFILLGLNNYGNRTIASVKNDKAILSKDFWSIYAMQLILGVIVCTVYLIYSLYYAANRQAASIMLIYLISVCIDINWFFFGMEMFKETVIRNTVIKLATTASIFLLVKEEEDVYMYCLIMAVGMLISQCMLWPYVKKIVSFYIPTWKDIRVHIKPNLVLFLTVIAVSLFKIMDKIMLGLMTSTRQVGLYESAERVISLPTSFITSLGTVMLPRMSNLLTESKNGAQFTSLLYKSIAFASFMSTALAAGIMATSKEFVPLFYGDGYEECVMLFIILLPTSFFFGFGNVIRTQYLLPQKMDREYVVSAFLGAAINILLNLALIPTLQSYGAAIGTLVAEIVVCGYQTYMVHKRINLRKYIYISIPFVLSGTCMFLSVYNISIPSVSTFVLLIIKVGCGVVIYCCMCIVLLYTLALIKGKKIIELLNL